MVEEQRARRTFIAIWTLACVAKLVVAARLPLFVDEAFYWQEGRHLAAAYSDLPGMTAWLARLGVALGGEHVLALRLPFLVLGALLPWWVMRTGRRWFGAINGWHAGSLAVLLPLVGTLGIMALPDVPLAFATVLCLHAGARLLREAGPAPALELALGLALGALSHYRFGGVLVAGTAAMLWLPQGRRLWRDPRVLLALTVGALAWVPLLLWNLENGEAGLRFQLVERHPWALHAGGLAFLPVQALLATPPLFLAMLWVAWRSVRPQRALRPQWRFLGLFGAIAAAGIFALGFVTDSERVSFHWPVPAWLALLPGTAALLNTRAMRWRRPVWGIAALGLVAALGACLAVSVPSLRAASAGSKHYPRNFAGWTPLAAAVERELAAMPAGTRLLAGDFKVGAELGFALGDPDLAVLDHPLNHAHGRAPQLRLWELQADAPPAVPTLLVLAPGHLSFKDWLDYYQGLCARLGPLPPARTVMVDHGAQRFLLLRLPGGSAPGAACVAPALAWVDRPSPGAEVPSRFEVGGWAFKEGVGLARVEVLLDGAVVAEAAYGDAYDVSSAFPRSLDPQQPHVGFRAEVDLPASQAGRCWLGLRLHGNDGSVEDWPQQPVRIVADRPGQ
ncbi:glycosyltransferase family 39 protein [Pseudoxanthomonas sp.]|uniref:glycosyltransferase family 39 protein n=1 Tax=Pseudoxanthomonas sp. TaxID=1871049 RepID=UPI0025876025|nr:glycosyltransferase family 39 protein [Pseudoxanthomonas sp.]MCR6684977.1 glycosyltransferase family 39 protein [Pseudoxanthomonas sp.]